PRRVVRTLVGRRRCNDTTRMNLYLLLDRAAQRFGPRAAVLRGTEPVATWAGLRSRALRLAAALAARHEPAARVAIVSENRPEYVEALFGIWAAGLVAVPINCKLHPREVAQIVA